MSAQDIQDYLLTTIFPVVSLLLGLLPILWQVPEKFRKNYWINLPILAALALLPSLVFLPSASLWSFFFLWFASFLVFAAVLQRSQIAVALYRLGLNTLFRRRVAVLIPSNAFFNAALQDSVLTNLSSSFRPKLMYETEDRRSVFDAPDSSTDYSSQIRRAHTERFKLIVLHAGSSYLDQAVMKDAIRDFVSSGGVIVNLVSDLGGMFDRRLSTGGVYSIVLQDRAGVDALMNSIQGHINSRDKVLLLKAPRSSKTGDRRLDAIASSLLLHRVTVDTIKLERWTAKAAYDGLSTQLKGRKYDWVIGWNDEIALGAVKYFQEQTNGKTPRIVGFDGISEAKKAVNDGSLFATIDMRMEEIGKLAAECIDYHCAGNYIPEKTVVEVGPRNVIRR